MKTCKAILAVLLFFAACRAELATGRSFFLPRPAWSDHAQMLDRGLVAIKNNGRFSFGSVVSYQSSTHGDRFAKYFLPGGKNNLVVKGANAAGPCDISGTWLQIVGLNPTLGAGGHDLAQLFNEYSSEISIKPQLERTDATVQLRYHNRLGKMPWSFAVGLPVSYMQTKMNLVESNVQNNYTMRNANRADGVPNFTDTALIIPVQKAVSLSAIESFSNQNKHFGKISNQALDAKGMGDVSLDLRMGICDELTIGVRGELPTSPRGTAEYMFEPLIGNNGHATFAAYVLAGKQMIEYKKIAIGLHVNAQWQMQFAGRELRTFDLLEAGSWSRYLLLDDTVNNAGYAEPGVNFLTRIARINIVNKATGGMVLDLRHEKGFIVSIGYQAYAREQEKLRLQSPFPASVFVIRAVSPNPGDAITDMEVVLPQDIRLKNHLLYNQGNIFLAPNPAINQSISNNDLDLSSGCMPSYFSHQLMASLAYTGMMQKNPVHFELGSQYEIIRQSADTNFWSLFAALTIKM